MVAKTGPGRVAHFGTRIGAAGTMTAAGATAEQRCGQRDEQPGEERLGNALRFHESRPPKIGKPGSVTSLRKMGRTVAGLEPSAGTLGIAATLEHFA